MKVIDPHPDYCRQRTCTGRMRGFSCDDETEVSSVILPWVRQVNHHITEFIRIETKALTACSALLLSAPCLNRSCYQCYCTIQSYKSTVLCNETQHVCRRQGLDYRCSCSQNTAAAGVSTRVATRQWILGLYTAVANRFIQCQLVTNLVKYASSLCWQCHRIAKDVQ